MTEDSQMEVKNTILDSYTKSRTPDSQRLHSWLSWSVIHSFLLFDPPYICFFLLVVNIPAPNYSKGSFLLYGPKGTVYDLFFFSDVKSLEEYARHTNMLFLLITKLISDTKLFCGKTLIVLIKYSE